MLHKFFVILAFLSFMVMPIDLVMNSFSQDSCCPKKSLSKDSTQDSHSHNCDQECHCSHNICMNCHHGQDLANLTSFQFHLPSLEKQKENIPQKLGTLIDKVYLHFKPPINYFPSI